MKKTTYKLIKAIKYVLRYDSKLKKFHCFKQARETKKKLETKECKKRVPVNQKNTHREHKKPEKHRKPYKPPRTNSIHCISVQKQNSAQNSAQNSVQNSAHLLFD